MKKRLKAVIYRSGKHWVLRVRESRAIQPVTRKGIERALERVYGKIDKRSAKQ